MGATAAEQEAAELQKQTELAQERVKRREKLGQQASPEPLLAEEPEVPEE